MEQSMKVMRVEVAVRNTEREKQRFEGYLRKYEEAKKRGGRK
jgi:hypothetical protein